MAVETEIHVVFPYNFKSDTHPLLFASRTIAILDVRALGSDEYTRAFEECFSQDTDFVLNYREYDETIDGGDAWSRYKNYNIWDNDEE